ncbi:MAG: EAL domain-containing protein [Thiohalophilus sp.]|uniref:EAL domain-containing protein n=1 Tax=Thiohalophilus sp. TaxID=3028392 RepID=UPI002870B104|nr:EAL domain-containing protein [Thiohalophilus sp.]MDR9437724.1 EAL domain-containing protein [Thiohalophilus sp.]
MKLVRLSKISIAACVTSLFALVLVGLHSMGSVSEKQAQIRALLDLNARVGAFSVASDALLVNTAAPARLQSYLDEAQSLKQTVTELAGDHPAARRFITHIDLLVDHLSYVYSPSFGSQEKNDSRDLADSPLPLSQTSATIINEVAEHGIELDRALAELTRHRQGQIAQEANWIAGGFAGAAIMFGLLCIFAFTLLYKRIHGPLQTLTQAARRVEAGEHDVRVPVKGSDEIADLSHTFNQMLDHKDSVVKILAKTLATRDALIDSLPAHIALLDEKGEILEVNNQWRQFGTSNDQRDATSGVGSNYLAVSRTADGDDAEKALEAADGLQAVLAGERDSFALEYPCHSPDQLRWFRMVATRLPPNPETEDMQGAVVMHVDITERRLAEQTLENMAYQDPLTGQANRLGFAKAFSRYVDQHGWIPHDIIALLDIREMRHINDDLGYDVGDQLLIEIAQRLEEHLSDGAFFARFSGDQFIILLPGTDASQPQTQINKLIEIFHHPIHLSEHVIKVATHSGYTLLGEDERSVKVLIHEVEIALHEGRRDNSELCGYDWEVDQIAKQRIALAEDLRVALQEDQLELHYQPKVDLATGELVACEALIRWMHPERGMQMPNQFIDVAEQSQLIGPIGNWVLFQACRHLREWLDAELDVVQVSVNVSVEQLRLGGFTHKVQEALETYAIDPAGLTLEITESVFSEDAESSRKQLDDLHELGVRISLDDFGTGYSSLLYLQKYPFDEIKIDMGFVRNLLEAPLNRNIVSMVLGISRVLGADTVAEGVENTAVRDVLIELGCRLGQGYYYSMPLEVEDFRWLLEQHSRLPLTSTPPRRDPLR